MLNKNQNQKGDLFRYFTIIPCLILLLALFSCDYNQKVLVEDSEEILEIPDRNIQTSQELASYNYLIKKYFGSNTSWNDILIKNLDDDIESGKFFWSSDEIKTHIISLFKEKMISESDLLILNERMDICKMEAYQKTGESELKIYMECPVYTNSLSQSIGNISWTGNTIYTDEFLSEYIDLKQGGSFSEDIINAKLNYKPDGNDLASVYMDKGYLFFTIEMKKINNNGNIDLVFEINEGDVFTVNKIKVTGNNKVNANEILKMIEIKSGDLFNRSKLIASQKWIAGSGLFDPTNVNPNLVHNPLTKTVEIEFQVSEL